MSTSPTGESRGANPAKVRFLGERVLQKGCLYLISQAERGPGGAVRRVGYATFDDPTGGSPEGRTDIAAGETPGPIRTLLAFTDEELAAEYLQEELKGVGEVVRFVNNAHDIGRMVRFMLGGRIHWFTFNRTPGSHLQQDRYTCWFISLRLFVNMVGKYAEKVREHLSRMPGWKPNVMQVPDEVHDIINKTRND